MGSNFVKDLNMQGHRHDRGITKINNDLGKRGCVIFLGFFWGV